jgi:uncharacterized protein YggT (Ycf19 family)
MDIILVPLLLLCKSIIGLALVVVIADVILGWMLVGKVLNPENRILFMIINSISRLSGFMLQPIRERIPATVGSIDISPVILALLLSFFEHIINRVLVRFM